MSFIDDIAGCISGKDVTVIRHEGHMMLECGNGATIIPISKVSFGYVTAGGDMAAQDKRHPLPEHGDFPFAGGSGAGVSVQPVGFLVVSGDTVRMLPAQSLTVADRMVELIPGVVEDVKNLFAKPGQDGDASRLM